MDVIEKRSDRVVVNMDKWSLKGKARWAYLKYLRNEAVFRSRDIIKLRKKLIDDVFDFTDDITVVSRQVLIKQINKRFGVDEE